MRRAEFRDALRRASEITGDRDLIVVGSQAIHASFTPAILPPEATMSMEVDVLALQDPDEDKMWALSARGLAYGVEVDAVGPRTYALPDGWMERLVPFPLDDEPDAVIGWCLEPTDLTVSKAIAGRSKDWAFIRALGREGLVDPNEALRRMRKLDGSCDVPRQSDVDRASAFLTSVPVSERRPFSPARRLPPKGRRRPTHSDMTPDA